MIYGTFSRLNVAKGVECWGKGLIYLKLLWGIDSSCSNDRPFFVSQISCLHFLPLTATCRLLLFPAAWLPKTQSNPRSSARHHSDRLHTGWLCWRIGRLFYLFSIFPRMKRSVRVNEACLGLKKTVWYEKEGERESFYNTRDFWSVWYTTLCVVGLGWNEQFLKEQGQSVWKYPDVSAVLCFSFFQLCFHCLRWCRLSSARSHPGLRQCHLISFNSFSRGRDMRLHRVIFKRNFRRAASHVVEFFGESNFLWRCVHWKKAKRVFNFSNGWDDPKDTRCQNVKRYFHWPLDGIIYARNRVWTRWQQHWLTPLSWGEFSHFFYLLFKGCWVRLAELWVYYTAAPAAFRMHKKGARKKGHI